MHIAFADDDIQIFRRRCGVLMLSMRDSHDDGRCFTMLRYIIDLMPQA